jgi:urea transport system permease protein
MRKVGLILVWLTLAAWPAAAQTLEELLTRLPDGSLGDRAEVVEEIASTGDPRAAALLEALGEGDLHARKADGAVIRVTGRGSRAQGFDALSGVELGPVPPRSTEAIKVNNSLRRAIRSALSTLRLTDPDPARRTVAAVEAFKNPNPEALAALEAALTAETDTEVRAILEAARASALLASTAEPAAKVEAIAIVAGRGRDALPLLTPLAAAEDAAIAEAAQQALEDIARRQAMWNLGQNVWFGLSLGSVLLLAAVGLAITFGVMGVINMAHGELIMLGAYTTFITQQLIRDHAPMLFDVSLLIAVPAAFLVAGAIGVAIERGIIRHLYGRPLETLLATWGVSLILQQAVRSMFGPTNREVGNPSWMSGSFQIGEMLITWNRFAIILFALSVFGGLLMLLRYTRFGLRMRAVTQNRPMAAEMGIRTGWTDALTFGLGAGIAGLAGVALSQIDNVSPNLGQSYIIDSFLVVVFGGAGNLWGTFAAAFSLGIVNKLLEPVSGAVLGKILILVLIVLFIQKRPRGLFPQRGRAAEA